MRRYLIPRFTPFLLLAALFVWTGCEPESPAVSNGDDNAEPPVPADYAAFWAALSDDCGQAYEGVVIEKPEGDDQLSEDAELTMHIRECSEEELRIPLHVLEPEADDWNRSRTWVLMPHEDGLELRHDHRYRDGEEEESSWYGAVSSAVIDAYIVEFISPDTQSGWRIEIDPGERFTYGTYSDGTWGYRLDFDLTAPIETPPAPWGFENGG